VDRRHQQVLEVAWSDLFEAGLDEERGIQARGGDRRRDRYAPKDCTLVARPAASLLVLGAQRLTPWFVALVGQSRLAS
jgi:hypothetical protein